MTLPSLNDRMVECLNGRMCDGFTDFTFSNLEGVLQHELGMERPPTDADRPCGTVKPRCRVDL